MEPNREQLRRPVVSFSTPEWGWMDLIIEGFGMPEIPEIRITCITDHLLDLPPFLESMYEDRGPARWVVDEEGLYVQLIYLPTVNRGHSGTVPPQLLISRDDDWLRHFGMARGFIDHKTTALSIYRAFRGMADDPDRDYRHWEHMGWDLEDGPPKPEWLLINHRSAYLDAILASENA